MFSQGRQKVILSTGEALRRVKLAFVRKISHLRFSATVLFPRQYKQFSRSLKRHSLVTAAIAGIVNPTARHVRAGRKKRFFSPHTVHKYMSVDSLMNISALV